MALCFSYHCAMFRCSSFSSFAHRAGWARISGTLAAGVALILLSACTVTRLPPASPAPELSQPVGGAAVDPATGMPVGQAGGAYPAATATPVPSSSVQTLPPLGAPPAPAVAGAATGTGNILQAGIFANASYAQSMAQKLQAADGGALGTLVRVQDDAGMYRVLVGPFATDTARQAGSAIIERTTGAVPFTYRGVVRP